MIDKLEVELNVGEVLAVGDFPGLGAVWAVAKAMNIFPPCWEADPSIATEVPLVGRNHHRLQVVYYPKISPTYFIDSNEGDFFILVTGTIPKFTLHGYWLYENLVADEKGRFQVFTHTITPFTHEFFYYDVLDDTRNWVNSYLQTDGKMVRKPTG